MAQTQQTHERTSRHVTMRSALHGQGQVIVLSRTVRMSDWQASKMAVHDSHCRTLLSEVLCPRSR
eukprot:15267270-Heterocapsa_arctica.AAC.1